MYRLQAPIHIRVTNRSGRANDTGGIDEQNITLFDGLADRTYPDLHSQTRDEPDVERAGTLTEDYELFILLPPNPGILATEHTEITVVDTGEVFTVAFVYNFKLNIQLKAFKKT